MNIFVGVILPIITLCIFIGGLVHRIMVWRKLPTPVMTLTPAPNPGMDRFLEVLKETFLFKNLFKGDKVLWCLGWVFHAMLALIFVGHFRVISWLPDRMLEAIGLSPDGINTMSAVAGGAAGIVILACLLFIMIRRVVVLRVRQITGGDDFFALFLIIAVVLTGDAMRFLAHFDLAQTRDYFWGLVTLSAVSLPSNPWFIAHYILGMALLMYVPFSKILHFGGIFFSQALLHRQ